MEKRIELKQIILATDGESNIGESPVDVAREAKQAGITINTIGIIEEAGKEKPLMEVQKIADASGGVYEFTELKHFSQTMEMLTQKSVYRTIEAAVSKELKSVLGQELEALHPDSRHKIINMIDRIGEEVDIKCCIVIDCSASMHKKIHIAKSSILNLMRSLKARKGKVDISVISYPDGNNNHARILCGFTEDGDIIEKALQSIHIGGTTPTGPALRLALKSLGLELMDGDEVSMEPSDNDVLRSNIV